ncbi:MAG TPA: hypothetical protein VGM19_00120 [Armatimonadota bacterium]
MDPAADAPAPLDPEAFGRLAEEVARDLHFARLAAAAAGVEQLLLRAPESTTAHELHGDVLLAQGDRKAAREAYHHSVELEPANADAERKYAELSLALHQNEFDREALLAGDLERFRGAPHKEPAAAAFRSLLIPGLGQLYNGDFELGITLAIAFLVLLLPTIIYYVSPLVESMMQPLTHKAAAGPGPLGWLSLLLLLGLYAYSAVQAYRAAAAAAK